MKEFVSKENISLKEFTDNTYPQGSFCLRRLLKNKDIRVNGVKVNKNVPLKAGDVVAYYTSPAEEQKIAFTVIYSDNNITVCDKESGVNSEAVFYTLCLDGEHYFIHRLDRNTSGLMVFAKNKAAEEDLLNQFKTHSAKKEYIALLFGSLPKAEDTVKIYLKKDERASRVSVCKKGDGGALAVTQYKLIKKEGDFSLVSVVLHTGKTHQIRATFAYLGCPVAGDEKYGDGAMNKKYKLARQCLISKTLSLNSGGALSYLNGKKFVSDRKFNISDRSF